MKCENLKIAFLIHMHDFLQNVTMFFTENMMIFVYICQSNDKYHDNKINTEKITKISKIQIFFCQITSL